MIKLSKSVIRWIFVGSMLISFQGAGVAGPVPSGDRGPYPDWWFERDVILRKDLLETAPAYPGGYPEPDGYAVLLQGQLKYLALQAKAELIARLPASVWTLDEGETLLETVKWTPSSGDNYAVMNEGQLKALAKLFYDVLKKVNYVSPSDPYPWTATPTDDDNYAVVNLGQAKHLFSFDLAAPAGQLPAWWQQYFFSATGISPTADADLDGISNWDEYLGNTNPTNASDPNPTGLTEVPDPGNKVQLNVWTPFLED